MPAVACCAALLLLWILDAPEWTRPGLVSARRLALLAVVAGVGAACSLATKAYPFAPLQFSLLVVPGSVLVARRTILASCGAANFFAALARALAIVALGLLLYFLLWVFALPPPASRLATGWNEAWVNVWGGEVKEYWRRLAASIA